MNKVMVFLHAAPGLLRDDFQHAMLLIARQGLLGLLAAEPMTINLVGLPPDNLPYRPPNDATVGQAPEYDVIAEIWGTRNPLDIARDFRRAVGDRASVFHAYAVTATEIYHRRDFHRGQPSAGIKLIGRLMFHADMPDSAVRRSWALHAGLAARVHVGSARYVQNWVDQLLLDTSPAARGIPIMHFPSEQDFFEAFVDSPRGMQEIIQDTSHFVAGGPRSYTTEYIIRGPG
jgi:hypothetical protein